MERFRSHDWNNDEKWLSYQKNFEITTSASEEGAAIERLKRRYFKKFMDPEFDPEPTPAVPPSDTSPPPPEVPPVQPRPRPSVNVPPSAAAPRAAPAAAIPASRVSAALDWLGNKLTALGINPVALWFMAHISILVNALLYLLPFFGPEFSYNSYRRSLYSALFVYAFAFLKSVGIPRFSKQGLVQAVLNENLHYVLLSVMFLLTYPVFVVLLPLAIYSVLNLAAFISTSWRLFLPPHQHDKYRTLLEPQINRLLAQRQTALAFAAQLEFFTIFLLILEIFLGQVPIILVVMYYWFLSYRYITSPLSRQVYEAIGQRFDSIFLSPSCPAVVSRIYSKIRGYLRNTVHPIAG